MTQIFLNSENRKFHYEKKFKNLTIVGIYGYLDVNNRMIVRRYGFDMKQGFHYYH